MTYHMNQLSANAMASSPNQGDEEGDLAVAPAKPKVKRPPLYKVVLLNDDYTPMEFSENRAFFDESRKGHSSGVGGSYTG